MKKIKLIDDLFQLYGPILSTKKREYIEEYYYNDKSLSEISIIYSVSRAAIYSTIKEGVKELENLENMLNFLKKQEKGISLISKINDKNLKKDLLLKIYGIKD